jgi:hypothetical protein
MTTPQVELRTAGNMVYSPRALEQDASEAMRGDIVRGLIEAITNADDAYARMGDVTGKIVVEVEHRRGAEWTVRVKDRATGMTQQEMRDKLIHLGGRSSGFESGENVRGNLGRGAKDLVAFGPALFESVRDEQHSALRLMPDGSYQEPPSRRRATPEDRQRLGIPRGNGTVVTVVVRPNIRCPNHSTLRRKLSQHFQLRDIITDRRREVVLVNLNAADERDRLRFDVEETETLRSVPLTLEGYPAVAAFLEIGRLPERCDGTASDPYRPCGILIKGRRAVYDNTLFSYENSPYAAFLHGRLVCEHIDTLAREYDDRSTRSVPHTADNPIPLISRTRDSLRREHPFYVALSRAAESILREVVREEEERARRHAVMVENDRTRRDLDRMAREAARFIEEELRNAEADELPPTGPGPGTAPALALIPGEAVAYLGENRTLTIVANSAGLEPESRVTVTMDPQGVVELIDGPTVVLVPHRRRDDVLVGQIRIQPLVPEITLLQCELVGRTAEALVEVREERRVVEPPEPPTTLEFERPRYRVGWNRTKTLVLRAPRDQWAEGAVVNVSSSSSGLVVVGGRIAMEFDLGLGYAVGRVKVEGRALGAEGTIRAVLGRHVAECRASVARDEEGPSIQFAIEDRDGGKYRALWEEREDATSGDRIRILVIQARHPALQRYLGSAPEFPGQNTSLARAVMAEIIADNVCREISRRVDAMRAPEERPDSEGFYAEHYARMLKLLPRLHRIQVPVVPDIAAQPLPDESGTVATHGSESVAEEAPEAAALYRE